MTITIRDNVFPLFHPTATDDLKDPCPVFDGELWHVFGSSGTVKSETWNILHATAPDLYGPWTEHEPIRLPIRGSGVAAPDANLAQFWQGEVAKYTKIVQFAKIEE